MNHKFNAYPGDLVKLAHGAHVRMQHDESYVYDPCDLFLCVSRSLRHPLDPQIMRLMLLSSRCSSLLCIDVWTDQEKFYDLGDVDVKVMS